MIPKIIHYIWLGGNAPNSEIRGYMSTWNKLQDEGYSVMKWDENYLTTCSVPNVVKAALQYKKYAFVTDWMRLKILYEYGGIYLDTDVEIYKSFSDIIDSKKTPVAVFLGFIFDVSIGTAVIGAEQGNKLICELLNQYNNAMYEYDVTAQTFTIKFDFMPEMYMVNNNDMFTAYFLNYVDGFLLNGKKQICGVNRDIMVCPKEYFEGYSLDFRHNYSIHHCCGSWRNSEKHNKNSVFRALKRFYIMRWIKDVHARSTRKNLPFFDKRV